VQPALLSLLLTYIERDSNITYYVINKKGDLRTNTHSEGPNAVTWGVYPGKEIIQPTIVEAVSFMAWKVRLCQIILAVIRIDIGDAGRGL
jgi:methylenetetrahydrofolate reductase (NADPH)